MKKISKKITAIILSLIIAVAIVPLSGLNIKVNAATGEDVVAYAREYLGCPYVSGATGPDAFDCSGFVSFIYAHFGISLPNSTYTIWNNMSSYGDVVDHGSIENAQAGDIIVWSGHVSIYTSDGGCIEALNPRYGVTEAIKVDGHTNGMDYYVLRIPGLEHASVKPGTPVISVDKENAKKGETITVSWNAVYGAESYRVLCKSGIINYVNSETTETSKSFALASDGTYTLCVFAKNKDGETQSNEITIKISKEHAHKYISSVTKAATCEAEGIRTYTCSCKDSYTEVIPATGHSYGEWVITKLATVSSTGERQRTCTSCGKVEKETIAKLSSDALIIDKLEITLESKETAQLMANKSVTWSSSDPKVATVDENGNVTAVGAGTAVITATAGNDTAECTVTVESSSWLQMVIEFFVNAIQLIVNFFGSLMK